MNNSIYPPHKAPKMLDPVPFILLAMVIVHIIAPMLNQRIHKE